VAAGNRSPWWCATSTHRGARRIARPSAQSLRRDRTWCRSEHFTKEIAHVARTTTEGERGAGRSPPLTSENDEESSGGETRTLNLAVNSRLLCH
jgi:hypothetical protein